MSEFTPLREAVDTLAGRSPSPDFGELRRRATRRGRRRLAAVAAVTAAVIAGSVVAVTGLDGDRRTGPVEQPKSVESAGPVWYDANGLHRGDVVEQTPVALGEPNVPAAGMFNYPTMTGGLALVRSGAVYLDPATGDVWFHPWGGKPRIVGHDSPGGPGGDPNGDTAAWFEGYDFSGENGVLGELVVYDTAAGREISRSSQAQVFGPPAAPQFRQVSADRVTWQWSAFHSHDVRTSRDSAVGGAPLFLEAVPADVHDRIEVTFDNYRGGERGQIDTAGSRPARAALPQHAQRRLAEPQRQLPSRGSILGIGPGRGGDHRHQDWRGVDGAREGVHTGTRLDSPARVVVRRHRHVAHNRR